MFYTNTHRFSNRNNTGVKNSMNSDDMNNVCIDTRNHGNYNNNDFHDFGELAHFGNDSFDYHLISNQDSNTVNDFKVSKTYEEDGNNTFVYGNRNNSGVNNFSSSKKFGTTPLTGLKNSGNQWTLVPCSELDANCNKEEPGKYEDTRESLGMGKGVYLETSHVDFLMCMALSGQSKDELISRCEAALLASDVHNVTESYLIAAKYGLNRVMDQLIQIFRNNFITVTQTRQFLELPVDLVELFLSDTFVNVGDELDVFSTALRWIDYNKQERLCQAGRVLNCVRYEKIRPIDIRDHIEPNIHLFNGPCGPEALVNIYRKHALTCSGIDDKGPLGPRVTGPQQQEQPQEQKLKQRREKQLSFSANATPSLASLETSDASSPPKADGAGKGRPPKGKGPGKKGARANKNASMTALPGHSPAARVRWENNSTSNSAGIYGDWSSINGPVLEDTFYDRDACLQARQRSHGARGRDVVLADRSSHKVFYGYNQNPGARSRARRQPSNVAGVWEVSTDPRGRSGSRGNSTGRRRGVSGRKKSVETMRRYPHSLASQVAVSRGSYMNQRRVRREQQAGQPADVPTFFRSVIVGSEQVSKHGDQTIYAQGQRGLKSGGLHTDRKLADNVQAEDFGVIQTRRARKFRLQGYYTQGNVLQEYYD